MHDDPQLSRTYQLEEVDKFVCILSCGEVDKVPWNSVAQTGAGLHRHLAGGVAERRAFLHRSTDTLSIH